MLRRNCASAIKLAVLLGITVLVTVLFVRTINNLLPGDIHQKQIHEHHEEHPRAGAFFGGGRKNVQGKRIDWHDYEFEKKEEARKGMGEMGRPETLAVEFNDEKDRMYRKNGFNALLSDKISVNRSVPDIRHPKCKDKKYLSELPTVSVVVPVFDEHWSTLLRTVYSVLNRSPPELLKEIILVDDFSDRDFLKAPLDNFVAENLPKVKVIHLPERTGLIGARLAGAKLATGDVLLFLDSHCEATVDWLPPLLEPIALNYKVCMCPFIDVIAHDTFEYRAQDEGARGAFDWQLYYKRLPVTEEDKRNMPEPFASPVMAGGLFAISAKFFWELGGYDPGLDIWGGEQYELSFKIWQCGGEMYDAPCSRVGHVYRGPMDSKPNPRKVDFITKNYKRVAEVWMDEYKEFIYERSPHQYKVVDAGDLREQLAIRERLQCKPFKWFMEEVAFDLIKKYPPRDPPSFAQGAIQNLAHPSYCIDMMNAGQGGKIGVFGCAGDLVNPHHNQYWDLSYRKDIRLKNSEKCMDVSSGEKNAPVLMWSCHAQGGNQYFRYHPDSKLIKMGTNDRCLELLYESNKKLVVNKCDEDNPSMQWEFGTVNQTAINNWDSV